MTGCFVGICRYDTGPIVAQAVVPVSPTDTPKQLAAKVLLEVTACLLLARQVCKHYHQRSNLMPSQITVCRSIGCIRM